MRYYRTTEWRWLRGQVLARDHYRCAVPGCQERARVVDHIVAREAGGRDHPCNLRSLCSTHDKQIKELKRGSSRRARDGVPVAVCDEDGMPMDPLHPWHRR